MCLLMEFPLSTSNVSRAFFLTGHVVSFERLVFMKNMARNIKIYTYVLI